MDGKGRKKSPPGVWVGNGWGLGLGSGWAAMKTLLYTWVLSSQLLWVVEKWTNRMKFERLQSGFWPSEIREGQNASKMLKGSLLK